MKTIEQKAKAYDKASKEVKDFFEGRQKMYNDVTQTLEYLFPELKESEDERIRKELIFYLRYQHSISENFEDIGKWIAWLEKQGEQKSADIDKSKFNAGDWISNGRYTKLIVGINSDWPHYMFNDGTSERIKDIDKKYHLWSIADANDGDMLYECNEKNPFIFKELETKHIGDIASYCDIFNGIFNPNEDDWTTLDVVPATKEQRDLLFQRMKEAGYEWDADKKELKKIEQKSADKIEPKFKIGDKIQYSKGCGIIMTIEKIENGEYIFANNLGHTTIEDGNKWYLVEHNPTWSEEDEKMIKTVIANIKAICKEGYYIGDVNSNELVYPEQLFNWLLSLKDRIQPKPKQEWSEEDEKILNRLISSLARIGASTRTDSTSINYTFSKEIDWLKSIKDRVQPKLEWNEEDNIILSRIIADYERSNEEWFNAQNSLPHGRKITWLKSLKNRVGCEANFTTTKEWNEEDEDILNTIINHFEIDLECTENDDIIRWLKSLKPQNKWKPSDEQMKVLKELVEDNNQRYFYTLLRSLYDQLKILKGE